MLINLGLVSIMILLRLFYWILFQVKIISQELEVERKRLPPMEDRIVHLESDLASQEDAVRYS